MIRLLMLGLLRRRTGRRMGVLVIRQRKQEL
jgi:hypothetical protein